MAEEEEVESDDEIEQISTEKFREMAAEEKYENLSYQFTPEFVNSLKEAFKIREEQIGQLNLPYWNVQIEK